MLIKSLASVQLSSAAPLTWINCNFFFENSIPQKFPLPRWESGLRVRSIHRIKYALQSNLRFCNLIIIFDLLLSPPETRSFVRCDEYFSLLTSTTHTNLQITAFQSPPFESSTYQYFLLCMQPFVKC